MRVGMSESAPFPRASPSETTQPAGRSYEPDAGPALRMTSPRTPAFNNTTPEVTMRNATLLSALLTLGLAACTEKSPLSPDPTAMRAPSDASAARGTSQVRPISGSCELTFTPLPSSPPILRQTDVGTCQLSHFGRATFEGVLELNLMVGTQRAERTLTAAHGDVLRMVSTGTSTPTGPGLVHFVATLTFVGGTGRFANATGQARGEGTATLATRTTQMTLDGEIAYDASDRGAP
jgi:hypothetical protein